jgi:transcriptional regulator with XRE-family HTH domain
MESRRPSSAHRQLLSALKELREGKNLSGQRFGELLEWSQSKVSKIETGRTKPSAADVMAWARATGATDQQTAELVSLADAVLTEARTWSSRHGTLASRNQEIAYIEAETTHLQNFQPAVVPGLLQVAEYARRVITMLDVSGERDVAEAVRVRMGRQTILYDQAKAFEFLLTESALRWRPGPPSLLLPQLDHLLSIATLPNVTIGVLPNTDEAPALYLNGFTIFGIPDDPLVLVETFHLEEKLDDEANLATYRGLFARMWAAAATGDEASALIRRIMADVSSAE